MDKTGAPHPVPIEYIEMIMLPSRGIQYSEVKRMTIAERHVLFTMLRIEAETKRPEAH